MRCAFLPIGPDGQWEDVTWIVRIRLRVEPTRGVSVLASRTKVRELLLTIHYVSRSPRWRFREHLDPEHSRWKPSPVSEDPMTPSTEDLADDELDEVSGAGLLTPPIPTPTAPPPAPLPPWAQ